MRSALMGIKGAKIMAAVAIMTLLLAISTPTNAKVIRASPNVIIKILGYNVTAENLSKVLNSMNISPVLGDEGLSKLGINSSELLKAVASNPKLASQLSAEEAAKLSALTSQTQPSSKMPSSVRVGLSALASITHNSNLKRVLEDWAVKGKVDINELKSKVKLSSLSPEDLTILKSALGLALKYGLISPKELESLGLNNVSPQDLKALEEISKELAGLNVGSNYSVLWSSLARNAGRALSTGNLTSLTINEILNRLSINKTVPYIARLLAGGLSSLASGGFKSTRQPLAQIMPVMPQPPSLTLPKLGLGSLRGVIELLLGSVAAVIAAYLAYMIIRGRATRLLSFIKYKGKAPKEILKGVSNDVVLNYWRAVSILSSLTPIGVSETHREYLSRVRGIAGNCFAELTKLYEVARWSGRKLSEREVKESFYLLKRVKECVKKHLTRG